MCHPHCAHGRAISALYWSLPFSPSYLSFASTKMLAQQPSVRDLKMFTGLVHRCLETVPSRLTLPFSSSRYWSSFGFHNKVCRDEASVLHLFSSWYHPGLSRMIACEAFWPLFIRQCRCSVFFFCAVCVAGRILLFGLFPSIPTFPYPGKTSAHHANQYWTGHKVNKRLAWTLFVSPVQW